MTEYQVSAVLDAICKKFGVMVDYLFPKIVRYCTVMSTAGFICSVIGLIVSIAVAVIGYKHGAKWAEEESWRDWFDKPIALIAVCVGSGVAITTSVVALVNLYNLISVQASPEVTAIKYIMSWID